MKVVLLGSTKVGKTSLINRLTGGVFLEEPTATVGASFQTYVVTDSGRCVAMQIWDTAGQERYRALTPMYYRSANAAILCFDITNSESFDAINSWIDELKEKGPSEMVIALVGTKLDLYEDRKVSTQDAKALAERSDISFYAECSAKTGQGVSEIFLKITELAYPNIDGASRTYETTFEPALPKEDGKENKSGCC